MTRRAPRCPDHPTHTRPSDHQAAHDPLSSPDETRFDAATYGQRWQVEAAFIAIKRRLGASLRGCTYDSQNRDMVLMVLTYNIMFIWHAMKGFLRSKNVPLSSLTTAIWRAAS